MLAGLGCALVVAVLGVGRSEWAVPVGAVLSGGTGLVGAVTVLRAARPVSRTEMFRVLIGLAALVWGTGQVLVAPAVVVGATYPTAGNLVSVLAGPLTIAGMAMLSRRSTEPLTGLRVAAEALVAGSAASALVWRTTFVDLLDPTTSAGVGGIVIIFVQMSVVSLLGVLALHLLDRALLVALSGLTVFVASDLWTNYQAASGGSWSWGGMALICLAWPLIAGGWCGPAAILRTSPRASGSRANAAARSPPWW